MDWIISDEYKLTVGHVLGHMAAAAMIVGGRKLLCKNAFHGNYILSTIRRYSALRAAVSSDCSHSERGRLQPARLPGPAHRQHPEDLLLVSFTWPSGWPIMCNSFNLCAPRQQSYLLPNLSCLLLFSSNAITQQQQSTVNERCARALLRCARTCLSTFLDPSKLVYV